MARLPTFTCVFCGKEHAAFVDRCPETGEFIPEVCRLEGYTIDGKYRVERKIAEGGMGIVYEGTHVAIGRKVAIKFLHGDIKANDELLVRFRNEARLAASIGHRNIVEVLDMGTLRGVHHYIVMEYLHGSDLDEILKETGRLTQREAVDLVLQILSGLKAAHLKGIIHRDLKPQNIFIVEAPGDERYVKILDFGVSRLVTENQRRESRITRSGVVFGTPRYMPPEQARGRADVDGRADIYATGAMLYEMLSGAPLFPAEVYTELIAQILVETPVHILKRVPQMAPDLAYVIMKAVEKEPDMRFQTAQEFIDALSTFSSSRALRRTEQQQALDGEVSVDVRIDDRILSSSLPFESITAEEESIASSLVEVPEPVTKGDEATARIPPESMRESSGDAQEPSPKREEGPPETGRGPGDDAGSKAMAWAAAAIAAVIIVTCLVLAITFGGGGKEPSDTATAEPAPPPSSKVFVENLPEGAKIYVDGVYYPDNPFDVPGAAAPRAIRIVLKGSVLLDEKIMIRDNTLIPLAEDREAAASVPPDAGTDEEGEEPPEAPPKKKSTGKKKTGEIDEKFPIGKGGVP